MSEGSESARILVDRLRSAGASLALAESCTGGAAAAAISGVPGASQCFWGGVVVYSAAAKRLLVGLTEADLQAGDVSDATTRALARAIRRIARTDVGAAVTGWAGPDSEGPDPVGTVYLAVADAHGETCVRSVYDGPRATVRDRAVADLLAMVLDRLPGVLPANGDDSSA